VYLYGKASNQCANVKINYGKTRIAKTIARIQVVAGGGLIMNWVGGTREEGLKLLERGNGMLSLSRLQK